MWHHLPGDLALVGAFACNLLSGFGFFQVSRGRESFRPLAFRAYHLFAIFTALAVVWLFYLFFSHNYAFKYIYDYSERSQPLFYILAAFWGGQEGTYLLWLFLAALFGYLIMRRGGQYTTIAMAAFSIANLFFLTLLLKLSPFALLPAAAPDGMGLNPLLRDPWMVIHPPVIFVGYAMAAIPAVLAATALIKRDYSGWVVRAFPWVAITSVALAAGNILGGFWAYKTLGWGGYWAWDPVENSSFVPWIASLALLHGMILERRTGALRRTNLFLAMAVFVLVVYGTFLTRSGVLSDFSVHSFVDLGINQYLVGFLLFYLAMAVVLVLWRSRTAAGAPINYNFYGREFSLVAGMLLLLLFGIVVLFWTSLPVLTSLVGAEPRAADISTYNGFALPLAILMAFLAAIAPLVDYLEFHPANARRTLLIASLGAALLGFGLFGGLLGGGPILAVVMSIVLTAGMMYLQRPAMRKSLVPGLAAFVLALILALANGVSDYLHAMFFAVAAMALVANAVALTGYFPDRWKLMGPQVTHVGFGLMLIGVLASSVYGQSLKLNLEKGGRGEAFGRSFQYTGMEHDERHPNNQLLLAMAHGGDTVQIRPQFYFSERMQGTMRKPAIERQILYDLYLSPEQITQSAISDIGLVLPKGENQSFDGLSLRFEQFAMNSDTVTGAMTITADIAYQTPDRSGTLRPATVHRNDEHGHHIKESIVDTLTWAGERHLITLERVLADQGAISISSPTLLAKLPGEQLTVDIATKPLINFTWGGAILILIGSLISFVRRRDELLRPSRPVDIPATESVHSRM